MYARVGTFQMQPGKMEEGIEIYRDSVVPGGNGLMSMRKRTLPNFLRIQ